MLTQLTNEEKALLVSGPNLVAALIAGADGEFSSEEIKRAAALIHIKTFSSKHEDLREIYKILDHNDNQELLADLMLSLQSNTKERGDYLSGQLAKLNDILPKLDYQFAILYYKSLLNIAALVASVDGGFWGMGGANAAEEVFIKLPMINKPEKRAQ